MAICYNEICGEKEVFSKIKLRNSASRWHSLLDITMHSPLSIKFVNAQREKLTYEYKNIKEKLYKTNVTIWHNKISREEQLEFFTKTKLRNGAFCWLLLFQY
jgi:hypothetical protein